MPGRTRWNAARAAFPAAAGELGGLLFDTERCVLVDVVTTGEVELGAPGPPAVVAGAVAVAISGRGAGRRCGASLGRDTSAVAGARGESEHGSGESHAVCRLVSVHFVPRSPWVLLADMMPHAPLISRNNMLYVVLRRTGVGDLGPVSSRLLLVW